MIYIKRCDASDEDFDCELEEGHKGPHRGTTTREWENNEPE